MPFSGRCSAPTMRFAREPAQEVDGVALLEWEAGVVAISVDVVGIDASAALAFRQVQPGKQDVPQGGRADIHQRSPGQPSIGLPSTLDGYDALSGRQSSKLPALK